MDPNRKAKVFELVGTVARAIDAKLTEHHWSGLREAPFFEERPIECRDGFGWTKKCKKCRPWHLLPECVGGPRTGDAVAAGGPARAELRAQPGRPLRKARSQSGGAIGIEENRLCS